MTSPIICTKDPERIMIARLIQSPIVSRILNSHPPETLRSSSCRTVLLLVLLIPNACTWAQGRDETVVKTGDLATDGNGTFSTFSSIQINEMGNASFHGELTGTNLGATDSRGVFFGNNQSVTQVARAGQTVADGNGIFDSFSRFRFNDSNQLAFESTLSGTTGGNGDNQGIFVGNGSTSSLIVRTGQVAPDGNGNFSGFSLSALSSSGDAVFSGIFENTVGGSSNTDIRGFFTGNGGSVNQIARAGQSAPDGNGFFFDLHGGSVNSSGELVFGATFFGTSGGLSDFYGVVHSDGSTLTQLARSGQTTPDGLSTVTRTFGGSINDTGQILNTLEFTDPGGGSDLKGLYRTDSSGTVEIVRTRQLAPDGSEIFQFAGGKMNNNGEVVFTGSHTPQFNDHSIYIGNGTSLNAVVRTGQATPDGNGLFNDFQRKDSQINDAGQVVFGSHLTGTSGGSTDNFGIYTTDGVDMIKVAREGDLVDGSTITSISGLRQTNSLNSKGQIAYGIELADGRQMVRTWTPDLNWRSNANGNWSDGNNWTLGLNPDAVHDVIVAPDTNTIIFGPSNDVTVRNLQLGGGTGDPSLRWGDVKLTANSLSIQNASLIGGGTYDVNSIVNSSGGLVFTKNNMVFNTSSFDNLGTVSAIGGSIIVNGDFQNGSSGLVEIQPDSELGHFLVGGSLINDGTLEIGSTSVVDVHGSYRGEGDVTGTGNLNIFGSLDVGNSAASILVDGVLTLDMDSKSHFELGGTTIGEFDQIYGLDQLNLDGDLEVLLIDGFTLESGMEFVVAEVDGTQNGQFRGLNEGDRIGTFGGVDLLISYAGGDGNDLSFLAVPEPQSVAVLLGTALFLGCRRRRNII